MAPKAKSKSSLTPAEIKKPLVAAAIKAINALEGHKLSKRDSKKLVEALCENDFFNVEVMADIADDLLERDSSDESSSSDED